MCQFSWNSKIKLNTSRFWTRNFPSAELDTEIERGKRCHGNGQSSHTSDADNHCSDSDVRPITAELAVTSDQSQTISLWRRTNQRRVSTWRHFAWTLDNTWRIFIYLQVFYLVQVYFAQKTTLQQTNYWYAWKLKHFWLKHWHWYRIL